MLTFESGEAFGGATTILPGLKKQMDTVFNRVRRRRSFTSFGVLNIV
jgi:hypothetical protein